jgi:hypothetical protein
MISRRLSSLVSVVLAVSVTATAIPVGTQDATSEAVTAACPAIKEILDKGYHSEDMCDREFFNQYKENVRRDKRYEQLKQEGGVQRVPNVKTITCPTGPVKMVSAEHKQGYDTTWFVENTAQTAVVLCWVDPATGKEYSAVDGSIAPPVKDPQAILKPGEWKAVWTHEGHVFYARELDPETGQAGRIVLQHRTGLVPVGVGMKGLSCPDADIEPFLRSPPPDNNRRCNQIDIGFRNAANCPLNGYSIPNAQAVLQENLAQQALKATISNTNTTSCPMEEFKVHLGMQGASADFNWDWQSNTKFEGSAIGHTFAFRLASNPSILVDTITLEPTRIIDCPVSQELCEMQITADSIIMPVRFGRRYGGHQNATAESLLGYYANATEYDVKMERMGGAVVISRDGAASAVSF